MKNVITILSHVFLFFILVQYAVFGQENISYIKCEQLACSIQNPFYEYKNVTAKLKGKCTNEFVSGKYFVSFYSDGILICQYDGDIIDGKLTGNGKIVYSSKDWSNVLWKSKTYEGSWENGKYQGEGIFTIIYKDKTKNILTGNWLGGNLEGNGKVIMPNGDTYLGEFKLGKFHGKGKYNFSNGNLYEGDFSNGLISGYGQYQTSEGLQAGYFANGEYIGKLKPEYISTNNSSKTVNSSPISISKIELLSPGTDIAFINNNKVSFKV